MAEALRRRSLPVSPAPPAAEVAARIRESLGALAADQIYRDRVLPQRTRRYELHSTRPAARIEILHTLLGIELKVGRRRMLCPDLATARYLRAFARLGCEAVALPYDITALSLIADDLESGWQRMLLLSEHLTTGRTVAFKRRVQRLLVKELAGEIASLGAGAGYPKFDTPTRKQKS